jgi:ribosomal-protein-alanine N-acetyltransferase
VDFRFTPMTEQEARVILGWCYEEPYDFYNLRPEHQERELQVVLDPQNGYRAAWSSGELVGFCAFGPDARIAGGDYSGEGVVDVGMGLRPDLTGKGIGPAFVSAVLDLGASAYQPASFRLTVAAFNQRAIRAYQKVGFEVESTFTARGEDGNDLTWTVMSRLATGRPSAGARASPAGAARPTAPS